MVESPYPQKKTCSINLENFSSCTHLCSMIKDLKSTKNMVIHWTTVRFHAINRITINQPYFICCGWFEPSGSQGMWSRLCKYQRGSKPWYKGLPRYINTYSNSACFASLTQLSFSSVHLQYSHCWWPSRTLPLVIQHGLGHLLSLSSLHY